MGYPTDRIVFRLRNLWEDEASEYPNGFFELGPDEVLSRVRREELNGEHELTIKTTRRLKEGWRALTVDGTGKWREWVVVETPEEKDGGEHAIGTYRLVWSLQNDLTESYSHTHDEIGYGSMPKTASACADLILTDVMGWEVGTCDGAPITEGGCVFIYESAWSKLQKAVELTGWEVDAEIEVSNEFTVTARRLCLKAHVGSEEAKRRFDWGHDVTSIKRTPDPGPYYCGIVPLGKGQTEYADDDETTFEWPIDITEETPDGDYYILDEDAAAAFVTSFEDGAYKLPLKAVSYDEDDPELLYNAGLADLHNHTRPGVTYEGNVLQFAKAGMDTDGVELGDETQIVDRGFNPDAPLRLEGRVTAIEVDELSPETGTELTIGRLRDDMGSVIAIVGESLADLSERNSHIQRAIASMNTPRYISELMGRINTEINALGGYAYVVSGEGIVCYDTAVADPLVGTEASKVVQIKGGAIRIADTKLSGFSGIDDWDWKSVFVSGHILSDLVTAVKITSGFIGNANSGSFWDLDNGVLHIESGSTVGGKAVDDLLDEIESTITGVDVEYAQNQSATVPPAESSSDWGTSAPTWRDGYYIWQRTATTDGRGTTYSAPTCISGREGRDGTSVTILGSYATYAALVADHPTGSLGDGYIVDGDLYVWDGTQWQDVGTIQGPQGNPGTPGANGTSVTVSSVKYGISSSAATAPTSWSDTVPTSITKGSWLWTKTTYNVGDPVYTKAYVGTDGQNGTSVTITSIQYAVSASGSTEPSSGSWSTTVPSSIDEGYWLWVKTNYSGGSSAVTKSYIGTDGRNGDSVYIQSASKDESTGITTVVLAAVDGATGTETTEQLTIADGADGPSGTPGVNGLSGYVHTAWANSANGATDFSTSVSANKKYLGVYTDNIASDSTNYRDYSWSLIKGTDGKGISSTTIQYGVSNSASTTPSSLSTTPPTSIDAGKWLWVITTQSYTDGTSKESVTKSYIGTDGKDGKSTYVESTSKSGKTTTVVIATKDEETGQITRNTMTVVDGDDGPNGIPGASGYVHTAWANSADGATDFSITVSANKRYLGVYTDNVEEDSTTPSDYSWSQIRGADGPAAYVHTAWANSADGATDFSKTVSANKQYIGVYSDNTETGSSTPSDYSWSLIKGADGSDAYTVLLTNESHTFAAGETAAVAGGSAACDIVAYKGTTRVAATIGTISDLPTGMTATKGYNGTTSAKVTFSVTASLTTRQGAVSIPLTVDGKSFTRVFSWSLALKGEDGTTVTDVRYGTSDSSSTQPTSWSTTAPTTIASGKWLWTRTTYSDRDPSYSKAYIGTDGKSITTIEEQYFLSTSSTTAPSQNANWQSTQPAWESGKYIWTRSKITWADGSNPTYTTPVLAQAINNANSAAKSAQDVADNAQTTATAVQTALNNYLHFAPSTGLDIGILNDPGNDRANINGHAFQLIGKVRTSGGVLRDEQYFYAGEIGPESGGGAWGPLLVLGGHEDGYYWPTWGIHSITSSGGQTVPSGTASIAVGWYVDASGNYSQSFGYNTGAYEDYSHAEGWGTFASGIASHAEGEDTSALGRDSHAEGYNCVAQGNYSHASGYGTQTLYDGEFACGQYNSSSSGNYLEVGNGGSDNNRSNALSVGSSRIDMFTASKTGRVYVNGSTVHGSDRRIKDHIAYLGDDAADFVRQLRPALFSMKADGTRHVGFYAQDVQQAEPLAWDTETVINEGEGSDPSSVLSLDYNALVAPLVAYCQQLERRVENLERRIDTLMNGGTT